MLISYAYVMCFVGICGVVMTYVYIFNSAGDNKPPCGTRALNLRVLNLM